MRYRNRDRSPARRLSGLVFFAIVLFAIFGHGFGVGFLPLLMIGLAMATLIGSFGTMNPRGLYGGMQSFVWFMGLALCFSIGFWPWIIIPIVISALLGIFTRSIIAALLGLSIFSAANAMNQQAQPMYTPPMQPYQPYGEGYQPPVQETPVYQEGNMQYPYPTTPSPTASSQGYEQPQSQYPPQEMPPQR